MTRQWHFWLLVILIVLGVAIVFWPAQLDQSSQSESATEKVPAEITTEAPATDPATDSSEKELAGDEASSGALLNQLAVNAWHSGDIEGAMALFEQAIDAAPDDAAAHSNYGRLLTLMTAFDQALPLLERARELTPDDAQTWLDLATLYERAQYLDKSWEARAQAEALVGSNAITRDDLGRFIVQGNSLW